jgi:hypothetical protein
MRQVGIFHVESHPEHKDFEQCVMFNSFPNRETELLYCIIGFLGMYLIPFFTMVFCYGGIFVQLYCRRVRPELSSNPHDSLTGESFFPLPSTVSPAPSSQVVILENSGDFLTRLPREHCPSPGPFSSFPVVGFYFITDFPTYASRISIFGLSATVSPATDCTDGRELSKIVELSLGKDIFVDSFNDPCCLKYMFQ